MDHLIWVTNRSQGKTSSVHPKERDESPKQEETVVELESLQEDKTTDDEMPDLAP